MMYSMPGTTTLRRRSKERSWDQRQQAAQMAQDLRDQGMHAQVRRTPSQGWHVVLKPSVHVSVN